MAIFGLSLAAGAFGQAFVAKYLEGAVEVQQAIGWSEVSIGDSIASDAVVRLSQWGCLELIRGSTKVTLLRDGVYSIARITNSFVPTAVALGNVIFNKLRLLVTEKPRSNGVGGVRGPEQGTGDVTWVDENDETRALVGSLFDAKNWEHATALLQERIENSASEADTGEFTYLLAVAYYGAGQTAKAYRTLVKVSPDPEAVWYCRYTILQAQILVDAQSYEDALAVLAPFIADHPTGEVTQLAYLLSAISHQGLGNWVEAKAAFDAGYRLDPSTDSAKLIDQARKSE